MMNVGSLVGSRNVVVVGDGVTTTCEDVGGGAVGGGLSLAITVTLAVNSKVAVSTVHVSTEVVCI